MSCEELRDHYELYAMGAADEPERNEIREHLGRGCEVCMAGIKRARTVTAMLSGLAAPATPSAKLRRRILASVGFERRSFNWIPVLAAATAFSVFAAIYFAGRERGISVSAESMRERMRQQNIELTRLNEAFAILNGPDTTMTSFGQGEPLPPKGKVLVNPAQGVLLVASNLPPAPPGKTYEMWVIPKAPGAAPVRAGEFQSEENGTAMHIRPGAVDIKNVGVVAVTLENAGGVDAPTSPPLILAELQ